MSFANENISRGLPAYHKAEPLQIARSPARKAQAFTVTKSDEPRSPLVSRSKPKQSYLKRGTGLSNRLSASKHKRYVPKGGFIKGQTEEDARQPQTQGPDPASNIADMQQAVHEDVLQPDNFPRRLSANSKPSGSSMSGASTHNLRQSSHPLQENSFAMSGHADHVERGFGAAQFHALAADTEPELDADTALVHYPHETQNNHDRPLQPLEQSQTTKRKLAGAVQLPSSCDGPQYRVQAPDRPGHLAEQHIIADALTWREQQAAEV